MRIKSVEPFAISLPMLKPVIMAGEEVRRADNVLVRIETDNGAVGWGEAASAPTMTGDTLESLVSAIHYLAQALLGRSAADFAGAFDAMEGRMYGNLGAKAAIDIALHDLVGLSTGMPMHALLGEQQRHRMPLLGVIGGGDLDGDLADAAKKKAAGFTIYKIKVGIDTPDKDAARTRAICDILGEEMLISADANQGFTRQEAIAYVRAVGDAGLDFFEQPVAAHDLAGMAAVASAAKKTPIGADEGIHSIDDIERHHAAKAARGVSLKAIKLGGPRHVVAAAARCDSLGMAVNISCKTGESSIACAAALHAAGVVPNIDWGLTLTHTALAADVTMAPLRTEHGHVDVLDRPGLGVDVDIDRVLRHRVPISSRSLS